VRITVESLRAGASRIALLAVTALAAGAAAADRRDLSEACEIAVARSAAPRHLRDNASVYALRDGRYEKVVSGDGPLTCVVERNHADALIPQCMDSAGVDSVLPAILDRSRMSLDGASFDELTAASGTRLDAGDYAAPARSGISYMMSAYNYIFVPSAGRVLRVPPHVMFYATGVTNEEIGGSFESMVNNIGTPFILNEGPHGYMVVYTLYPASPDEVAEACRGELGEAPPAFNPSPKG